MTGPEPCRVGMGRWVSPHNRLVRTLKLNALDVVPRKWIDLRLLASYHKCEYRTRSTAIARRLTSDKLETADFWLKDFLTWSSKIRILVAGMHKVRRATLEPQSQTIAKIGSLTLRALACILGEPPFGGRALSEPFRTSRLPSRARTLHVKDQLQPDRLREVPVVWVQVSHLLLLLLRHMHVRALRAHCHLSSPVLPRDREVVCRA